MSVKIAQNDKFDMAVGFRVIAYRAKKVTPPACLDSIAAKKKSSEDEDH